MNKNRTYRIVQVNGMSRPECFYDNGYGRGHTSKDYYFSDHDSLENAEEDIKPCNTDYWTKEYEELIIISIYNYNQ